MKLLIFAKAGMTSSAWSTLSTKVLRVSMASNAISRVGRGLSASSPLSSSSVGSVSVFSEAMMSSIMDWSVSSEQVRR